MLRFSVRHGFNTVLDFLSAMLTLTGRLLAGTLRNGEEQVSRRDILVVDARMRLRTDLPLIPMYTLTNNLEQANF